MARRQRRPSGPGVGTQEFTPWNPATGQNQMSMAEFAARHPGIKRQAVMRDKYYGATNEAGGRQFMDRMEGDPAAQIAAGRVRIIPEAVPGASPATPSDPTRQAEIINSAMDQIGAIPPDQPPTQVPNVRMNGPAPSGIIGNRLAQLGQGASLVPGGLAGAMLAAARAYQPRKPGIEGLSFEQFNKQAGKKWTPEQKRKGYARMTRKREF